VGTKEETLAALYLTVEKYEEDGIALPGALHTLQESVLANQPDLAKRAARVLAAWTDQHYVPAELASALHTATPR
jgi:hypothetical protein